MTGTKLPAPARAGPTSTNEEKAILKTPQASPSYTSNDLLSSLNGDDARSSLNYETVAQSAEEVQDVRNSPAVSMGPWLIDSGQTHLLTTISIYSQRGESRGQIRLLYMNATALRIWRAMGKRPTVIAAQHRPPSTALLAYGVPFSE
jgi:hypothetical protein